MQKYETSVSSKWRSRLSKCALMIHDDVCHQMAAVTSEGIRQFEPEVHTPHHTVCILHHLISSCSRRLYDVGSWSEAYDTGWLQELLWKFTVSRSFLSAGLGAAMLKNKKVRILLLFKFVFINKMHLILYG